MRSMTAASSALDFGVTEIEEDGGSCEFGTCAMVLVAIDPTKAAVSEQMSRKLNGDRREGMLHFFYPVPSVKSNQRSEMIFIPVTRAVAILVCFCSLLVAQVPPLAIVEEPLPGVSVGIEFHYFFHAAGGYPPYVWTVASDDLPEGVTLSLEGLLSGRATKPGSYTVTVKVVDSIRPAHTASKEFKITIASSLLVEWHQPPKVAGNRIDGSLQVTNGSTESFDLTVIVVAVAENGRATAIGYQHFPLNPGAKEVQIPFGNTLPHGAYVIHADAIAEIPNRNTILRQRLQTPQPLQVVQGP
jgi:hypothetical protein